MIRLVRPARMADLPGLFALAQKSDRGMTTMPQTEAAMEERIALSEAAFAAPLHAPERESYMLVLEEEGRIVGLSCLFTGLGADRPFYNYRIAKLSKHAPELGIRMEADVLHLVNDFHGYTELGTLFLDPDLRGGGRGRLLSMARLMLIACAPPRFGDKLMAEIRGWVDAQGRSPFWEAVGRKFFDLDYEEADQRSAIDNRFIADLMPSYPLYTSLLADEVQAVIGRPHAGAAGAIKMLQAQGFRDTRMVDIFDAGPCVEARLQDVPLVRTARHSGISGLTRASAGPLHLIANPDLSRFAVTLTATACTAEGGVPGEIAARLRLDQGEKALTAPVEAAA